MARELSPGSSSATQEVKAELDSFVVTIELTLISIIQGVALAVLASSALDPVINLRLQFWPYVGTGLLTILIFWSRAVIHTLSFIDWPLEFMHNFLYFGATLVEALALSQVAHVANWFILNACYAASIWLLYRTDLQMLRRHAEGLEGPAARRLFDEVRRDQLRNVRVVMPLAVGFHVAAWLLVIRWSDLFLAAHWHVLLGLIQLSLGIWYLLAGLPLLAGRDSLIYQRYLERRLGGRGALAP
jgi:hypothetical protein